MARQTKIDTGLPEGGDDQTVTTVPAPPTRQQKSTKESMPGALSRSALANVAFAQDFGRKTSPYETSNNSFIQQAEKYTREMLNAEISKQFPGQPDKLYSDDDPVSLLNLIIAIETKYNHDKGGQFYTNVMKAISEKPVEVYVYCPSGHYDEDGRMIDVPVSVRRGRVMHTFYSWKRTLCSPFIVSKLYANARSYKFSLDTTTMADPANPNMLRSTQVSLPASMQIKISDRPFRNGTEDEIEADATGKLSEYYSKFFDSSRASSPTVMGTSGSVNIAISLPSRASA